MQGIGINTTGQDLAAGRHYCIICSCQPGNTVKQYNNVIFMLNQPFCFLHHHLRNLYMSLRRLIKGGTDHLCIDASRHVGDLFRTFVNQKNDQNDFLMIFRDTVGDVLNQNGLPGPWRGNDQPALSFADRRGYIHNPH